MGIGARIREVREKLGFSQAELAQAARVRQPSVAQWETEKTEPTRPTLRRVADALRVSPHFLEFGEDSRSPGAERVPYDIMPRNLPIYAAASIAESETDEAFTLDVADPVDFVRRPPILAGAKGAYVVYLVNSSMSPWRKQGQMIYVNPTRPAAGDNHVVVQLNPDHDGARPKALIKLLVGMTACDVTLRQYNPERELVIARSRIVALDRVMDWDELLQF